MDILKYHYTAHVPVEQYGFISVEVDGTADEAVAAYRGISEAVKVRPKGLSAKDFIRIYDLIANGEPIEDDPGIWEQMDPYQRYAANELKKCLKRAIYKLNH